MQILQIIIRTNVTNTEILKMKCEIDDLILVALWLCKRNASVGAWDINILKVNTSHIKHKIVVNI